MDLETKIYLGAPLVFMALTPIAAIVGMGIGKLIDRSRDRKIQNQRDFVAAWEDYVERWESGEPNPSGSHLEAIRNHRARLDYERAKLVRLEEKYGRSADVGRNIKWPRT